jgi:hypothetical protein
MSIAVRVWEDNFKILSKIRSKSERNALCFALISYGFSGEVPQDLKLNENNLLLFEVLKNNFIAKNQGGAPVGNFNRCSTVEKNNSTDIQPLSENIKQKTENILPPDNNKLLSSPKGVEKPKIKKFIKPTIEEISLYCQERKNTISAENFFNFYESKGWRVGNQPMKDWKAAVRTWESKERTLNAAKNLVRPEDYKPLSWL